jgi:AraC-like DNA-binding protein
VGNTTIEKYIILRKINKAKGLIIFDELNFAEISYELGYSSPAHFSNQFKTITGYSPLQFKKMVKHIENQKIM